MQPQGRKRVNIILNEVKDEEGQIIQKGGVILRVSERLALDQVNRKLAVYTSKQKLKSAFKREQRANRNLAVLSKQGFKREDKNMVNSETGQKFPIYFDPTNGKVFVAIKGIRNSNDWLSSSKLNIGFYQRQMPIQR